MADKNNTSALWLGWIGVIAGVISFFAISLVLGAVAIILGIITISNQGRILGWCAIIVGIFGFFIHWLVTGTLS